LSKRALEVVFKRGLKVAAIHVVDQNVAASLTHGRHTTSTFSIIDGITNSTTVALITQRTFPIICASCIMDIIESTPIHANLAILHWAFTRLLDALITCPDAILG
jgi:hypothetical protein